MDNISKTYNINGPVNIMRLTNNNKIIYLFGDIHLNKEDERPCPSNIKNIDIDKLLLEIFEKNKDIKYNLFCETYISNNNLNKVKEDYQNNINSLKYIRKIFKIVIDNINYDNTNSIIESKKYPNVKFHWFDIRNIQIYKFHYIFGYLCNNTIPYDRPKMKYIIKEIKNFIFGYDDMIKNLNLNHYIKKLLINYKDLNIKIIINYLYDKYVINTLKKIYLICNQILNYYNINEEKINNNLIGISDQIDLHKYIYVNLKNIDNLYGIFFCSISDLFILRRILDKDYIQNSIIYCGAFHMSEIAYYLIKYFNFKLTNISYSIENTESNIIGKINHIFSKIKYDDSNSINFLNNYLVNDNILQCSNLFTFPNDLL
jgi:hypothetical protein